MPIVSSPARFDTTRETAVSQIVAQLVRGLLRKLEPIQQLRFFTAMVRDQEVEGSNPFAPTIFLSLLFEAASCHF